MRTIILFLFSLSSFAAGPLCSTAIETLEYVAKHRSSIRDALRKAGSKMTMERFEELVRDGQITYSDVTKKIHWTNALGHTTGNALFKEDFDDLIALTEETLPTTMKVVEKEKEINLSFKEGLEKLYRDNIIECTKCGGTFHEYNYVPGQQNRVPFLEKIYADAKSKLSKHPEWAKSLRIKSYFNGDVDVAIDGGNAGNLTFENGKSTLRLSASSIVRAAKKAD